MFLFFLFSIFLFLANDRLLLYKHTGIISPYVPITEKLHMTNFLSNICNLLYHNMMTYNNYPFIKKNANVHITTQVSLIHKNITKFQITNHKVSLLSTRNVVHLGPRVERFVSPALLRGISPQRIG